MGRKLVMPNKNTVEHAMNELALNVRHAIRNNVPLCVKHKTIGRLEFAWLLGLLSEDEVDSAKEAIEKGIPEQWWMERPTV